ncbi:MAG TPA: NADP-dependent phosphogluconate dehydrogenase [Candidatus Dormibacteraeota bacterium]
MAESQFGVYGLAVMGMNLARNVASRGIPVAIYNRTAARTDDFLQAHGGEGSFTGARSVDEFVAALARPRRILLMVKAGDPVDATIRELAPLLEDGDILIDGGNSHFADTERRGAQLEARRVRFLGTGVSGGEEGALHGPSIMPGGPRDAYEEVAPVLTQIAAQVEGEPCCTYIGPGGAGHYVKMVHNGIEYADMQLIAEAYDLLRQGLGLEPPALAEIFQEWNQGDLDSYLIQITAQVLAKTDERTGKPLVDVILDEAAQKGTGKWSSQDALDLGVPTTAISEAVFARYLSAMKPARVRASGSLAGPAGRLDVSARDGFVEKVRDALYASKIVAYAQGFEQIRAASEERGWGVDPGPLSRIWRGGCIIRARFLNRIAEAFSEDPELENLLLSAYFREGTARTQDAWRAVVGQAVAMGVPTPAFASALAYYDGYRRERAPANLIQGLRDYFGAHTYKRVDAEGSFHTRWSEDGAEVQA